METKTQFISYNSYYYTLLYVLKCFQNILHPLGNLEQNRIHTFVYLPNYIILEIMVIYTLPDTNIFFIPCNLYHYTSHCQLESFQNILLQYGTWNRIESTHLYLFSTTQYWNLWYNILIRT